MCSVEALVVAVLPRTPWIDADGLDPDLCQPGLEVSGNELRAIIRPDELRPAVFQEERVAREGPSLHPGRIGLSGYCKNYVPFHEVAFVAGHLTSRHFHLQLLNSWHTLPNLPRKPQTVP